MFVKRDRSELNLFCVTNVSAGVSPSSLHRYFILCRVSSILARCSSRFFLYLSTSFSSGSTFYWIRIVAFHICFAFVYFRNILLRFSKSLFLYRCPLQGHLFLSYSTTGRVNNVFYKRTYVFNKAIFLYVFASIPHTPWYLLIL